MRAQPPAAQPIYSSHVPHGGPALWRLLPRFAHRRGLRLPCTHDPRCVCLCISSCRAAGEVCEAPRRPAAQLARSRACIHIHKASRLAQGMFKPNAKTVRAGPDAVRAPASLRTTCPPPRARERASVPLRRRTFMPYCRELMSNGAPTVLARRLAGGLRASPGCVPVQASPGKDPRAAAARREGEARPARAATGEFARARVTAGAPLQAARGRVDGH